MKDYRKRNEISFKLQDKHNREKTYKKGCYCFKSGITHLCIFYSEMEDVWVTVLLNGWIKVNNKKMEHGALAMTGKAYSIDIDGETYHFFSITNNSKTCSKVVSEFVGNGDDKRLWKEDIFYYFETLRNFDDHESYLDILMHNPVFERDTYGLIKINYFIYGLVRYYDTRYLLYAEFEYYMRVGRRFNIIELHSFLEEQEHYNYMSKNHVHCREGKYTIPEYIYNLAGNYYLDRLLYPDSDYFEISRLWIGIYNLGGQFMGPNKLKRKIDLFEDFNIKKSCKSDDGSEDKVGQFCNTLVCREVKLLQKGFTEVVPIKKRDRTQKKRSHSLVEDKGSINDKVWMINKQPNDI